MGGDVLVKEHVVNLLLQEFRVCQLASEIAVVGEKQHTGGVAVKTAYGIYALRTSVLDQVHDGLALLRVVAGGHRVLRLVEQHVHLLLHLNGLVVELHVVSTHNLRTELGNHVAVDRHDACLYELVGLAAAAYSGVGEELVKADGHRRVDMLLLVFDAFLKAVLCMRVVVGSALAVVALAVVATLALLSILRTLVATTLIAALTGLVSAFALIGVVTRTVTCLLAVAILVLARLVSRLQWLQEKPA